MKKTFLNIILITLSIHSLGQNADSLISRSHFGITLGYISQNNNFWTIGGLLGKHYRSLHVPSHGYGMAAEFNLNQSNPIYGAKVFYEYNFGIILGSRINATTYFKGSVKDFRLTPEIGLSGLGIINFFYGYNIPVVGSEISEVSRHRFNITLNIIGRKD